MKRNSKKSFYIRAQMKRISEDAYVRDEGRLEERAKAEAEKAELLQQAEIEKSELLQQAEVNRKTDKLDTAKRLLAMGLSIEEAAKGSDLDYNTVCKLL